MKRLILTFAAGIVISMSAYAHHSLTTIYDSSKQVSIDGVVSRFQFINPHPIVTVNVKRAGRSAQEWRIEMDNRSELAAIGMTSDTFKPGDRVVVTGNPGRTESESLYVLKLDRPADGLEYEQIDYTPYLRFPSR